MRTGALLIVLAGCSFPTRNPFDCNTKDLPKEVMATIEVHGTVIDYLHQTPVSGATVTGFEIRGSPLQRYMDHTNGAGSFSWSEMAEGPPQSQLIQSHSDGYHDTFFYIALPVASDLYVKVPQLTQEALDRLPMGLSLFVSVVDCNDEAVADATVTVRQGSNLVQVVYLNGETPDPTLAKTALPFGAAIATGLVQGSAHIEATFGNIQYMAHDVMMTSGAVTATEISP